MKKREFQWKRLLEYFAAILIGVLALFPFYWAINTSLKTGSEIFSPSFIPDEPSLANYLAIFREQPFHLNILNSLMVAITTVTLSLAVAVLASYALARHHFRGRGTLLMVFLGVSMFPQVAVLSGLFEVIRFFELYDNPLGLTLSYMLFTLPFTVWTLTTFMGSIPRSLEEAAIMDGASSLMTIKEVFVPLMGPAFATTGILAFIGAWNEFLFALTFTLTDTARTVPVAIALMSGASQFELPWGPIMAASVVVTIPLIVIIALFQRRIISGLTAGAVKG